MTVKLFLWVCLLTCSLMSCPNSLTIIVDVVITSVADAVFVVVLLVQVGDGGAVVAGVSLLVCAIWVGVQLVWIGHQGAVVLGRE